MTVTGNSDKGASLPGHAAKPDDLSPHPSKKKNTYNKRRPTVLLQRCGYLVCLRQCISVFPVPSQSTSARGRVRRTTVVPLCKLNEAERLPSLLK